MVLSFHIPISKKMTDTTKRKIDINNSASHGDLYP
jgi:hypothetical protein